MAKRVSEANNARRMAFSQGVKTLVAICQKGSVEAKLLPSENREMERHTMLSKADDYPIHQSPEPIAYAGQSRNFYDRYFFNGYDADGGVFFALGMGVYPHLDVIDGVFPDSQWCPA